MRRERKAAKIIWIVDAVLLAALGLTLLNYFSTSRLTVEAVPQYTAGTGENGAANGKALDSFVAYSSMSAYWPNDVVIQKPVVPEPKIDAYISVTKAFPHNSPPMCKLVQKKPFKDGKVLTSNLWNEGDILPDGTKIKEIRDNGVLFEHNTEEVFIELKPED